jgi:hypothetical protein
MTICESAGLERLRYRQGQTLRSLDFNDQAAVDAQLRWWHNRALHKAYGIVAGFETAVAGAFVTVGPGLAYDCFGRALMARCEHRLAIPALAYPVTLLVRRKDAVAPQRSDACAAVCAGACSPCGEGIEFIWMPSATASVRNGVILGRLPCEVSATLDSLPSTVSFSTGLLENRVRYDADKRLLIFRGGMSEQDRKTLLALSKDKGFRAAVQKLFEQPRLAAVRPLVRPLARPRMAVGATVAGHTAWESWSVEGPEGRALQVGVQVRIDASASGFTEIPSYLAWLQGPLWNRAGSGFLPFARGHVDEPSISGFVFRIWTPGPAFAEAKRGPLSFRDQFAAFARTQGLSVSWLALQPRTDLFSESRS